MGPSIKGPFKISGHETQGDWSSKMCAFLQDGLVGCKNDQSSQRLNLMGAEIYPGECDKERTHP